MAQTGTGRTYGWVLDVRMDNVVARYHGGGSIDLYHADELALDDQCQAFDMINVYDYQAGAPRIAVRHEAVAAELEEWLAAKYQDEGFFDLGPACPECGMHPASRPCRMPSAEVRLEDHANGEHWLCDSRWCDEAGAL